MGPVFESPTQFAPIVAFLLFRTVDVMGGCGVGTPICWVYGYARNDRVRFSSFQGVVKIAQTDITAGKGKVW